MSEHRFIRLACWLSLGLVLWAASPSSGQKLKVAPNPQAPQVNMLPQLSVLKGSTLEIDLAGARLNEPTGLWTDIPGAKATIPTENNNGKDQAKALDYVSIPDSVVTLIEKSWDGIQSGGKPIFAAK